MLPESFLVFVGGVIRRLGLGVFVVCGLGGRSVSVALVLMSDADKATSAQQRHNSTAQHRIFIARVNEKLSSSEHMMRISLALHCMKSNAAPACKGRKQALVLVTPITPPHMSDKIPVNQHSPALRDDYLVVSAISNTHYSTIHTSNTSPHWRTQMMHA